jgi:hypothetical protein
LNICEIDYEGEAARNWLRIVPNSHFRISCVEFSDSATRVLFTQGIVFVMGLD